MADRVGQQLGNYRLTRLLGRGSFGEVYLGEHMYLKTEAAIKVLRTRLADNDVQDFLNEAQTIARLVHPHIVRIFDFNVQEGAPFLVMDYAPNGTLRQRHPRGTSIPLNTVVSYVKQVADALQYAHDQKLIHRDVKPENMLVGRHNDILLSDFGTVQVAQSTRMMEGEGFHTVAGTVTYMSPEQLQGKPRTASDQYALGVIVYEWLSGERPFQGALAEMVTQHMFMSPMSLCEKVPTIPSAVEAVVLTALAKDYKQRFASVQAFANALEQAYFSSLSLSPASNYAPPVLPIPAVASIPLPPTLVKEPSQPQQQLSSPSNPSLPAIGPILTDPPAPVQQPVAQSIDTGDQATRASHSEPPQPRQPVQPVVSPPIRPRNATLYSSLSKGRTILLIGLALLVVASGLGLFYILYTNQIATTQAEAIATAQAIATDTAQTNATATAQAIATATASVVAASPDPYPPGGGTLALYDPLHNESIGSGWDTGSINCTFTGHAYQVSAINIDHSQYCTARSTDFSNFAFEVQINILQGDVGGMIFRADAANNSYYIFFVGRNGYYSLFACKSNICNSLVVSKFSPAIKQGLNQSNTIAVVATGTTITLYVNGKQLASMQDSTFTHGQIGVLASPAPNTSHLTEVAYTNARVWTL
jgi:serine/threonine protein kinase